MTTFEDPGSPDMGLKQLVVGKSKKAGGTLGWVGSAQVFEVGGDVWLESRVHQRIFLVADETDVRLSLKLVVGVVSKVSSQSWQ